MKIEYNLRYSEDGGESYQTMTGTLRGRCEPRMKSVSDLRRFLRRIHDFDFDTVLFDFVQVSWPRVETPARPMTPRKELPMYAQGYNGPWLEMAPFPSKS